MKLIIQIKERNIALILQGGEKEADRLDFPEEHNLSEKLLSSIDELLKRNSLKAKNLEKVEVLSDQGESFTTTRIALATANALNWAKKFDRKF